MKTIAPAPTAEFNRRERDRAECRVMGCFFGGKRFEIPVDDYQVRGEDTFKQEESDTPNLELVDCRTLTNDASMPIKYMELGVKGPPESSGCKPGFKQAK
jgi:hypothetical protein